MQSREDKFEEIWSTSILMKLQKNSFLTRSDFLMSIMSYQSSCRSLPQWSLEQAEEDTFPSIVPTLRRLGHVTRNGSTKRRHQTQSSADNTLAMATGTPAATLFQMTQGSQDCFLGTSKVSQNEKKIYKIHI